MRDNQKYPDLIFPPHGLRRRTTAEGVVQVWVPARGRWLVLTPEEEVRRRVVRYLAERLSVPAHLIVEEQPVLLNCQPQRADIVVFDPSLRPWLIVECKAPNVPLGREVLDQVVRYNSVIGASQVVITNGLSVRAYARRETLFTDAPPRYVPCDFPLP